MCVFGMLGLDVNVFLTMGCGKKNWKINTFRPVNFSHNTSSGRKEREISI